MALTEKIGGFIFFYSKLVIFPSFKNHNFLSIGTEEINPLR